MNRAILQLRNLNRGLFVLQRPSDRPLITSAIRIERPVVRPDRIGVFRTAVLTASDFTTPLAAFERAPPSPEADDQEDDYFRAPPSP